MNSEYAEQLRQHGDRLQLTPEQVADYREQVERERQERERNNGNLLDIVATLATSNRYAIARHLQQINDRFPYYGCSTRETPSFGDRLARKNGTQNGVQKNGVQNRAQGDRSPESDVSPILPLH